MASPTRQKFSRLDLDALMDRAIEENGAVIIKRPGRKDLAIIPAAKLRDMDTTDYLLASPINRKRLANAIKSANEGKGRSMTVKELRKTVGMER